MPVRAGQLMAGGLVAACALCGDLSPACAQSLEPRAYSPAPTGVNFVIAGVARTEGGVAFDPSVPLTDAELSTGGPIFAYARTLDVWGRSGKVDVIVPFVHLSGSALFEGQPVAREVTGMADPLARLSLILHGARAMDLAEFRTYRQDLIIGASIQVSAPIGQYDPARLVNIGTNRWSVRPEIGISKALGRFTLELDASVTFYTDNDDFFGGSERSQQPLFSGRAHAIYSFPSGIWASLDATYFTGGRTTIDGVPGNDLQSNWRLGATLALPLNRRFSVKFYASSGVSARTGNNFDLFGTALQYRWGGGL